MEGQGIQKVIKYWMEGEITTFIKIWFTVYLTLCYCYLIGKIIPKGTPRFLAIFPVVCLFLALPLNLNSMHLSGLTSFFIAWLSNFKLLMFAFGTGPLSDSSISLKHFVAVACLPIKLLKQNPPPKSSQSKKGPNSLLGYAIKSLVLLSILKAYDYTEYLHPKFISLIYTFQIYFTLELMLVLVSVITQAVIGAELEPQFDRPLVSKSLQEFWGRRWNLAVTRILNPSVYIPVRKISTRILGEKWAPLPAIMATFIVSALMHELIFYYLGRMRPNWEVACFFLLHGACLMVELAVKKVLAGKLRLPSIISTVLTVGFVIGTTVWLFLPEIYRCEVIVKAFQEYASVGAFVKDVVRAFAFIS